MSLLGRLVVVASVLTIVGCGGSSTRRPPSIPGTPPPGLIPREPPPAGPLVSTRAAMTVGEWRTVSPAASSPAPWLSTRRSPSARAVRPTGLIALAVPAVGMAQPERLGADPDTGCVVPIVACSHSNRPHHAQSLVAVARLAREMREQFGPPTKIYTTADLPDIRRVTEPTLAWVSQYLSLLEAARERERVLLERRRERQVQPAPVLVKTVRSKRVPAPPPTPPWATSGVPLYLAYGAPVIVASPHSPRPRDRKAVSDAPRRHGRGSRPQDGRSRLQTTPRRATSRGEVEPSARRPTARNGYEQSSRPFPYIARRLPVPGRGRYAQDTGAKAR